MITTWILLMLNSLFFSLRVGATGSFPRPLKAEEERECLEKAAEGDMEARNKLIEHNLRLVAHIINKDYSRRIFFWNTKGQAEYKDYCSLAQKQSRRPSWKRDGGQVRFAVTSPLPGIDAA